MNQAAVRRDRKLRCCDPGGFLGDRRHDGRGGRHHHQQADDQGGGRRNSPDGPKSICRRASTKITIKVASRAAQNEEVEVGADQTWGLLIGPGGVMPMQLY